LPKTRRVAALRKLRVAKRAAALSATLTLLCACAGAFANPGHLVPARSPAQPQSQTGDLLYVVNYADGTVDIYDYPAGTKTGTLTGFTNPEGACTNADGDVFIANTGGHDILEFGRGATKPKRRLADGDYRPNDCAIDPLNGDLAVSNLANAEHSGNGSVAIYRGARGNPKFYTGLSYYLSCAYDRDGNLFADGVRSSNYYFKELPEGGSTFRTIKFGFFQVLDLIGWDGKYVTDEVPKSNWSVIYRLRVRNGRAHIAGVSTVSRRGYMYVDRPTAIVTGAKSVAFFDYPSGAGPTKTIPDSEHAIATVVSRSSK
jgi:hypothetical protein